MIDPYLPMFKTEEPENGEQMVRVYKITNGWLMRRACAFTIHKESKMTLPKIYECEHSPMRTQWFWIEMFNIPTFVSVHFRTHKIGIQHFDEDEHFVKSNREDRPGYTGDGGRWHPVNHAILCNSQSLINMSRKRLCTGAHAKTIQIMSLIKSGVRKIDPDLAERMVKDCVYRKECHEGTRGCGWWTRHTFRKEHSHEV